ncbi:hypothetical protein DPMN_001973 [Dreissena polymorpha]|uniref:Uncharacterized protein n=1 Tax=Dreissena polymorpha TaxID=45954 RepID=A0A9D4MIT2_DREPO|nr:hypothetical protein DPMN_001973 [Dreissena polymorpha]
MKMYSFISSKRCEMSGVQILGQSDLKTKAEITNAHFTKEYLSNTSSMDSDKYPTVKPFDITETGIKKASATPNPA